MSNGTKAPKPRPQTPMPVPVAQDAFHRPLFVKVQGQELRVDSIDRQWQVDAEPWERKPVAKVHYLITLEDGRHLSIFKNMEHGGWYQESLDRT